MTQKREIIAKNIAGMLHNGDIVNLGVGIPSLVGNYIPEDVLVLLHCENGCVGMGKEIKDPWDINDRDSVIKWMSENMGEKSDWRTGHKDLCNANDVLVTLLPGACCFDSAVSFIIARGGHLDTTILGGLQVDTEANLANWTVPGKKMNGMGGAMDLVSGAKKVIVAMEHCTKTGEPKLVKHCSMPLTAVNCVNTVVTELCVIEFKNGEMVVTAMIPGLSREELQAKTEAPLKFASNVGTMTYPD